MYKMAINGLDNPPRKTISELSEGEAVRTSATGTIWLRVRDGYVWFCSGKVGVATLKSQEAAINPYPLVQDGTEITIKFYGGSQ